MCNKLIPNSWNTEKYRISNTYENEVPLLQEIQNSCFYINSWDKQIEDTVLTNTIIEKMQKANESLNNKKEIIVLQTIKTIDSDEIYGFIECYHGYPDDGYFCISDLEILPKYQNSGCGSNIVQKLLSIVESLGYKHIYIATGLKNWPAIRFWYKNGFDKIINVIGDRIYSEKAFSTIVLEKT
jgi:diamine N-acetyltransferase